MLDFSLVQSSGVLPVEAYVFSAVDARHDALPQSDFASGSILSTFATGSTAASAVELLPPDIRIPPKVK